MTRPVQSTLPPSAVMNLLLKPVFEALERGEIDTEDFVLLAMMYKKLEGTSRIVRSWSAEHFLRKTGQWVEGTDSRTKHKNDANLADVHRRTKKLREAGWFGWTYVLHSIKPYDLHMHIRSSVADFSNVAEKTAQTVAEENQVNPCEIESCGDTGDKSVAEEKRSTVAEASAQSVAEDGHQLSFQQVVAEESENLSLRKPSATNSGSETCENRGAEPVAEKRRIMSLNNHKDTLPAYQSSSSSNAGRAFEPNPFGQKNAYAEEPASPLMRSLPRIAAKILQSTHRAPRNTGEKFCLVEVAFGVENVEVDFENWCWERKNNPPKYPITEYLMVIDHRLGRAPLEPRPNTKDPVIKEIGALTYKLTGILPSTRSVARLRLSYEPDEIKAALTEYASKLEPKDFKSGMKSFFTEGGANSVIYLQRERKGEIGVKPEEQKI